MSLSCSHCMGRGRVRRNDGEKKCQLCGGLGQWGTDPEPWGLSADHGVLESVALTPPCDKCGGTAIDSEVLRRFDMVSPCQYCTLPPDRKEETEDYIISELLDEKLNDEEDF